MSQETRKTCPRCSSRRDIENFVHLVFVEFKDESGVEFTTRIAKKLKKIANFLGGQICSNCEKALSYIKWLEIETENCVG